MFPSSPVWLFFLNVSVDGSSLSSCQREATKCTAVHCPLLDQRTQRWGNSLTQMSKMVGSATFEENELDVGEAFMMSLPLSLFPSRRRTMTRSLLLKT